MKILFSYTLQGQSDVNNCLNQIKESKIPLNKCRFSYVDESTRQYLLSKNINEIQLIKSCGLGLDLDRPLNVMRLSKNKPDYVIIGLNNTKVTRYSEFELLLKNFQNSLSNKLCVFTTEFMYPFRLHQENRIDPRVIICSGIHKELLNNYVDTCEKLDVEISDLSESKFMKTYIDRDVLENMKMSDAININFKGLKNQTLFQQFFLSHLSDYI